MSMMHKFELMQGSEIDCNVGIFVRGTVSDWITKIKVCGKWFKMRTVQNHKKDGIILGFYETTLPASIMAKKGDVIKLGNDGKHSSGVRYTVEMAEDIWLVGKV